MNAKPFTIGVLTSGGDAPVRSVVRTMLASNASVLGIPLDEVITHGRPTTPACHGMARCSPDSRHRAFGIPGGTSPYRKIFSR